MNAKANDTTPKFLTSLADILKSIKDGKESYLKVRVWVHEKACEAVYHAAQHGDARAITALYDMVSQNDKSAFRAWANRMSTFETGIEDKTASWLKYASEAGFSVKSGDLFKKHRVDQYTPEQLLASTPFYDVARATRVQLEATEKKLKGIQSSLDNIKTIEGRFESLGIAPSEEVDAALELVKAFLAEQLAAVSAETPVAEQTEETQAQTAAEIRAAAAA